MTLVTTAKSLTASRGFLVLNISLRFAGRFFPKTSATAAFGFD